MLLLFTDWWYNQLNIWVVLIECKSKRESLFNKIPHLREQFPYLRLADSTIVQYKIIPHKIRFFFLKQNQNYLGLTSFYLKNEGKEKKKILLDILHHLKAQMVNYEVKASALIMACNWQTFLFGPQRKQTKIKYKHLSKKKYKHTHTNVCVPNWLS